MSHFSISGKTAIITGAAHGVGLAIARHFAGVGARVMMVDADEKKLIVEAQALADGEDNVTTFTGDLRQRLTINNLVAAAVDNFDTIDILVNANRIVRSASCLDPGGDCFEDMLNQNVQSNLRLTQKTVSRMLEQSEDAAPKSNAGTIINLSSIVSQRTDASLMSYSVSASALNQLTRSMALRLAPSGVRVNAIAIGSVMSGTMRAALKEDSKLRERIVKVTPLGRIAEAEEVVHTAQFLASEASSFLTGQIITLDGGRTLFDPVDSAVH